MASNDPDSASQLVDDALSYSGLQEFNKLRCQSISSYATIVKNEFSGTSDELISSFDKLRQSVETIPQVERYVVMNAAQRLRTYYAQTKMANKESEIDQFIDSMRNQLEDQN